MSMWKRITSCGFELEHRMKRYYDEKGLGDIRIIFADWIEETILLERADSSSSDLYEQISIQFCETLKQKLLTLNNDFNSKPKLAEYLSQISLSSPTEVYGHMSTGLQREYHILQQMPHNSLMGPMSGGSISMHSNIGMQHTDKLRDAHDRTPKLLFEIDTMQVDISQLYDDNENFKTYWNELNTRRQVMPPQTMQDNQRVLAEQMTSLQSRIIQCTVALRRVVTDYDTIQEMVIEELKNWQRNQALAGNGAQFRDNLDDIQRCVEILVNAVYKLFSFVTELIKMEDSIQLKELLNRIRYAQEVLVCSAFIVEKQPPQVMKTNTRFSAAVRWLIGPQLGIYTDNPQVECVILSEAQAKRHSAQRTMNEASPPVSSGEILNNNGQMELQQQSNVFSANFRNMQLKKIRRAEKKGTESVMDEKFALLFYTSCRVNDYKIRVWTLSLPVVVIVHGNQEPQSWATITWDNAFSEIMRDPFVVPDEVSWPQLAYALNTKFGSATGRLLTDENLSFLHDKLFRRDGRDNEYNNFITWAQFCKEPLPERTFTFWDWFFAIMKLTKDHLLGPWKAGLIVGFIDKNKTIRTILSGQLVGTFLLRFSDSELGGISVALVKPNKEVGMLTPWIARDLQIRGLADRVHDLDILQYAYPNNVPRDAAFQEFYTQSSEQSNTRDGYVGSTIRAHVPAIEGGSIPNPSQNLLQSPHPQDMQLTK